MTHTLETSEINEQAQATAHSKPKHAIRLATKADTPLLADILADAFEDDPVLRWIMPQADHDKRFMTADIHHVYMPHKHCWVLENGAGAACWLPPGKAMKSLPLLSAFRVFAPIVREHGLAPLKRGNVIEQTFKRQRPKEPHYYLHIIGARRAQQGKGVGSALLKHCLAKVDEDRMPAYLESSNVSNVPLYERYGFRVKHQSQLGEDGPTVWYMWRESQ